MWAADIIPPAAITDNIIGNRERTRSLFWAGATILYGQVD